MKNMKLFINGVEMFRIENNKFYKTESEVLVRCTKQEFKNSLKYYKWILNGWDEELKVQYKEMLKNVNTSKIKLNKMDMYKIIKTEKACIEAHKLIIELREYLLELGLDEDVIEDELNSLKIGDITSEDIIEWVNEELNNKNK